MKYKVGIRVKNKRYGAGVITIAQPSGSDAEYDLYHVELDKQDSLWFYEYQIVPDEPSEDIPW